METNIKICVGIPTYGTIKSKTALSLMETINKNKDIEFFPVFCHGGYIAENREKLVKSAQQLLCSHIFFVDHDMKFAGDTIRKLLNHDKDVVGVLYNCRYLPLTSTTLFFGENGEQTHDIPDTKELIEVPVVGAGCMLIKMSVFTNLTSPYFPMENDDDGNRVVTEDAGFCKKVRESGSKVWCDLSINCLHIGDYEF
jgi:hypothetical protein